jgi:hypothetical protein
MNDELKKWDLFISHASEDKETFVRPLAVALKSLGISVWYDEFALELGDSISRSIDKGLTASVYGLVVISPSFIRKPWPEYELRGLVSREVKEDKVILPIWHGVTREQVVAFSPTIADKLAIDTSRTRSEDIAIQILRVVRPDLYSKHPRAQLERIASGDAIRDLQQEIERMKEELEAAHEELSEYRCPYCAAPLIERINAPADPEEKYWDLREIYECGYMCFGGYAERPCPSDPKFPKFHEYELKFFNSPNEQFFKWQCYAFPKTDMARKLSLDMGFGRTKEEAAQSLRDRYNKHAEKWKG